MSARVDLDHPRLGRAVVWAVAVLGVAAFVAAFPGLEGVARAGGIERPVSYLVPGVIDLGLAVMLASSTVARLRGERSRTTTAAAALLVSLSCVAQVYHATIATSSAGAPWPVVPVLLAAAMPITLMLSAEAGMKLVVGAPVRRTSRVGRTVVQSAPATSQVRPARSVRPSKVDRTEPASDATAAGRPGRAVDADLVRARLAAGESHRAIAMAVGTSKTTVSRIAAAS